MTFARQMGACLSSDRSDDWESNWYPDRVPRPSTTASTTASVRCGCSPRCPVPLTMCPACPRVLRPRGGCAVASLLAHAKEHARKGCAGHSTVRDAVARAGRDGFTCLGCEAVVRGKLATLVHLGACEGAQRRLDDAMTAMPPTRANANANANAAREREATLLRRERRVRETMRAACWREGGCRDPAAWMACVTLGATHEGWGISWRRDEWCAACGEECRDGAGMFAACGVCKRVWHSECAPPPPGNAANMCRPVEQSGALLPPGLERVYGDGDEECVVCADAISDRVCVPCGHVVYCGPCASVVVAAYGVGFSAKRCPICRANVRSVARLDRFRDERGRHLAEAAAAAEAEAAVDFEALGDL